MSRVNANGEEFAIAPTSKLPVASAVALLTPAPVILALIYYFAPESGLAWPHLILVIGIELALLAAFMRLMRWRRVSLTASELVVRAALNLKRAPLDEIDHSGVRILDLGEHPEARPLLRTNGFALPGFLAGHYRDRKKRKVFALVTRPRVLMVPLKDGSRILLSLEHPHELLNRLSAPAA